MVLTVLGLGALGVVAGSRVQHVVNKVASPLGGLIPGSGTWTLYTVTGGYPAPPPDYHIKVTGLVERDLSLTVADLKAMPATYYDRTFQCVTGWEVGNVHWIGVRLTDLATVAKAKPSATALHFTSFDGIYTESLTMEQARQSGAILAYSMLGAPVTREHGGPVRLYVPDMFGYKSIKWLSGVEFVDQFESGYWEQYGYPINAWIDGHPPVGSG